jgi:basic membrane protein A and related proteins
MRKGRQATVLTTLVFTDIVSSTAMAEEMGDRRWRELLDRHYTIIRRGLREHGGKELDTAGDGVFARFDSPAAAIRWASAVADGVRELGIELRVGIHIGEAELLEGKLSGVNVHAAARTMGEAEAGQILVTSSVRDLVRGSGFGFEDRGVHELRGIDGEWHLHEVVSVDGETRPAPSSAEEARARRGAIQPPPLMKRRRVRRMAIAATVAFLFAGVSLALAFTMGGKAKTLTRTGCMVAPFPPLNDHSFNQAVFDGLTDAGTTWGVSVRNRVTDPPSEAAARRNLEAFAKQRCGLVVSVGGFMAPTTAQVARRYPDVNFLTTDDVYERHLKNLASIRFDVDQAAFLAGYLAAAVTKTGKVATFGGAPTPTVNSFMRGFAAGVLRYNVEHAAHVELVGWDLPTQTGSYVTEDGNDATVFVDTRSAAAVTVHLIKSGADVIMPVDGPAGATGGGNAVRASRAPVLLIGVDADQFYSTPQFSDLWLTSVLKVYRRMVYLAMGEEVLGHFQPGTLRGTLANDGVDLAPFHRLGKRVSPRLRKELRKLEKHIEDGSVSLDPASYT